MSGRYDTPRLAMELRSLALECNYRQLVVLVDRMHAYVLETSNPTRFRVVSTYTRFQRCRRIVLYLIAKGFNITHKQFSHQLVSTMHGDLVQRYSSSTVNDLVSCLRCFFDHLVRRNEVVENPVTRRHTVTLTRERKPLIRPEQAMEMANALAREGDPEALACAMFLATSAHTGMRLFELWTLKILHFVESDPTLGPHLVVWGKVSQQRTVPLTRTFARLLCAYRKKYCGKDKNSFMFADTLGHNVPLSVKRLGVRLQQLPPKYRGSRRFSATAARHGFATELFARGMSYDQIHALYDHRARNLTLRYLDREEHVQKQAVAKYHPMFKELARPRRPRLIVKSS